MKQQQKKDVSIGTNTIVGFLTETSYFLIHFVLTMLLAFKLSKISLNQFRSISISSDNFLAAESFCCSCEESRTK